MSFKVEIEVLLTHGYMILYRMGANFKLNQLLIFIVYPYQKKNWHSKKINLNSSSMFQSSNRLLRWGLVSEESDYNGAPRMDWDRPSYRPRHNGCGGSRSIRKRSRGRVHGGLSDRLLAAQIGQVGPIQGLQRKWGKGNGTFKYLLFF